MDKELQQKFIELNAMRQKVLMRLVVIYGLLFLLAPLGVSLISDVFSFENYIIVCFGLIILCAIFLHRLIIKNYRKRFKEEIVPIAVSRFGKNITYSSAGIDRPEAEKTDMFAYFTRYISEDTVYGTIEDVKFRCADVKIGYYRGSGKNRQYVRVCHGQLYIFDFNKRFNTKTILREKILRRPKGTEKFTVERIDFNNLFYLYTNNEHDAFYILTPHFMEKLIMLEKMHPGNLFIAFYNSQLFIGIDNSKNRFEPPILSPITMETIQSQIDDLKIIKDIILELKLNNKIFIYDESPY